MNARRPVLVLGPGDLDACLPRTLALRAVAMALDRLASGLPELPPSLALRRPEQPGRRLAAGRAATDPGVAVVSRPMPGDDGPWPVVWHDADGAPAAVLPDGAPLRALAAALGAALAVRHLARPEAAALAILGAADGARRAATLIAGERPLGRIGLWTRDTERGKAATEAIAAGLDGSVPVALAHDRHALVAEADIVVAAARAPRPLVQAPWVAPGAVVVALGSPDPADMAVAPDLVAAARPLVVDAGERQRAGGLLRQAVAWGRVEADHPAVALGDIVAGRHPGRTDPASVIACLLTPAGVVETALARLAVERAAALGLGHLLPA